jgi:hypothetical protein
VNRIFRSLLALSLIAGCSESLSPEDFYAVWAGEGARLTLSSTQARFETSCWAGDMAIPILVDGDQFTAIGNIHSQGGAGVNGRLDGDVLRLTVETSFQLGPYRMQRDAQVQITGCP